MVQMHRDIADVSQPFAIWRHKNDEAIKVSGSLRLTRVSSSGQFYRADVKFFWALLNQMFTSLIVNLLTKSELSQ